MKNVDHKILVLIPSRRGVSVTTLKSVRAQTVPVSKIVIADKIFPANIPVGKRVAMALNSVLPTLDLSDFDYILRTDDDAILAKDFIEENLKTGADIIGSSGYGQLIKVEPFLKHFKDFPIVVAEDSYVYYAFMDMGLKVSGYAVRPKKIRKKKHSKSYWINGGMERYRTGYMLYNILISFREPLSGFTVGLESIYIIIGYLMGFFGQIEKHSFSQMVRTYQMKRLHRVFSRH